MHQLILHVHVSGTNYTARFLQAHSDGRKFEVKFRPDDRFCKPAVSRTVCGTSLILKVKRRKERDTSALCNSETMENVKSEYSVELMGVANKIYQFSGAMM